MANNGNVNFSEQLDRMRRSMRQSYFKASKEYKAVVNALQDVVDCKEKRVFEGTDQMLEAHARLGEACDKYLKTREGARTGRGKERLGIVGTVYRLQQQEVEGINAMRSPSTKFENFGATWGDVLAEQRIREIDVTGMELQTVGAGSNTRNVVPMGDKVGFFTDNQTLLSPEEFYTKRANAANHPQVKAAYQNLAALGGNVSLEGSASSALQYKDFNESYRKDIEEDSSIMSAIGWNNMSQEARDEFLTDGKEVGRFGNTLYKVKDHGGVETGANLPVRNVASTRLAELLGEGNLLAKSEKARLKNGTEIREGVMMDGAKGIDFNSTNQDHIQKFGKADDFSDPNLQRQVTNLEVIDYLAGQTDRNPSNMFYQFSEEAGGKPKLIGIQGIDNDAAFGNKTDKIIGDSVMVTDITMVDADLAANIQRVDRPTLEYTFGDILSPNEIGALDQRFNTVKDQLKNARLMQPGDWNLETCAEVSGHFRYLGKIKEKFEEKKDKVIHDEKESAPVTQEKEENAPENTKKELSLDEMMNEEKAASKPEAKSEAKPEAKHEAKPEIKPAARENSASGLTDKAPAKTEPKFVIGGHRANKGRGM